MKFYTLGPEGSCHEHVTKNYISKKNIDHYEIILFDDILEAADSLTNATEGYLIQCSAHLQVHIITEKYLGELFVIDAFVAPTQPLAILKRKDISEPSTLGIPEPALGYINNKDWNEIILVSTKPVVARNLLLGKYDAGFAYQHNAVEHPDKLEIMYGIGEVDTAWVVYGKNQRHNDILTSTTQCFMDH